jgi:hypothetical protein
MVVVTSDPFTPRIDPSNITPVTPPTNIPITPTPSWQLQPLPYVSVSGGGSSNYQSTAIIKEGKIVGGYTPAIEGVSQPQTISKAGFQSIANISGGNVVGGYTPPIQGEGLTSRATSGFYGLSAPPPSSSLEIASIRPSERTTYQISGSAPREVKEQQIMSDLITGGYVGLEQKQVSKPKFVGYEEAYEKTGKFTAQGVPITRAKVTAQGTPITRAKYEGGEVSTKLTPVLPEKTLDALIQTKLGDTSASYKEVAAKFTTATEPSASGDFKYDAGTMTSRYVGSTSVSGGTIKVGEIFKKPYGYAETTTQTDVTSKAQQIKMLGIGEKITREGITVTGGKSYVGKEGVVSETTLVYKPVPTTEVIPVEGFGSLFLTTTKRQTMTLTSTSLPSASTSLVLPFGISIPISPKESETIGKVASDIGYVQKKVSEKGEFTALFTPDIVNIGLVTTPSVPVGQRQAALTSAVTGLIEKSKTNIAIVENLYPKLPSKEAVEARTEKGILTDVIYKSAEAGRGVAVTTFALGVPYALTSADIAMTMAAGSEILIKPTLVVGKEAVGFLVSKGLAKETPTGIVYATKAILQIPQSKLAGEFAKEAFEYGTKKVLPVATTGLFESGGAITRIVTEMPTAAKQVATLVFTKGGKSEQLSGVGKVVVGAIGKVELSEKAVFSVGAIGKETIVTGTQIKSAIQTGTGVIVVGAGITAPTGVYDTSGFTKPFGSFGKGVAEVGYGYGRYLTGAGTAGERLNIMTSATLYNLPYYTLSGVGTFAIGAKKGALVEATYVGANIISGGTMFYQDLQSTAVTTGIGKGGAIKQYDVAKAVGRTVANIGV